jgi:DNA mismatch repair protein MutL
VGQIALLSPQMVNKIAAGEVIERPASVVKELLENSIDAAATRIDVQVEDGGAKRILVTDDGAGMDRDDLELAFHQHATSKLTQEADLFAVRTMGFRGEALASIAAVAHVQVASRTADAEGGHALVVRGGAFEAVRATGCPVGTRVEVRNLFYNTPARRKFLKTTPTELGHVIERFARVALAYPSVHMTLSHNGQVLHELGGTEDRRERIGDFFGAELAEALIPVAQQDTCGRLAGLIAPPSHARSSGKWQYVFVNGRYVRDRLILHALREGYRGLIEHNRQPVAFLFLTADPGRVDVNVHPTKIEVRFLDASRVHSLVLAAVRSKLLASDLSPSLADALGVEPPPAGPPATHDPEKEARGQAIRQAMADFFKGLPPMQGRFQFPKRVGSRESRVGSEEGRQTPAREAGTAHAEPPKVESPEVGTPDSRPPTPDSHAHGFRRVTQMHNAYLVAETDDAICLIDQHALHERVLYEQLRRRASNGPLESQRLLIPEPVDVTATQLALLEGLSPILAKLGIEVTPFGPRSVAIQSFPSVLARRSPAQFLRDLLDAAGAHEQKPAAEDLLEDLLRVTACHAAVKAGDPLRPAEIDDLLAAAGDLETAQSCPHGRPTVLRLSLADLEKQFRRT